MNLFPQQLRWRNQPAPEKKQQQKKPAAPKADDALMPKAGHITIDDFAKVECGLPRCYWPVKSILMRINCWFQLDFGNEKRQIISGIAKYYEPEALVGEKSAACTEFEAGDA